MNKAAQQSTLRLPNGKVIHVRKQVPVNPGSNNRVQYSITSEVPASSIPPSLQPLHPQPIINQQRRIGPRPPGIRPGARMTPSAVNVPRMANSVRPMALSRGAAPPNIRPPPPLIINSVTSGGVPMAAQNANGHLGFQQAQMQMQQMLQQQQQQMPIVNAARMPVTSGVGPSAPMIATAAGPMVVAGAPTIASGPALPGIPRIYGSEPVGRARSQLERQIYNAMQICHQIDGKLKTLMNSNAYKNAKKMHDIKELYIHLSYLFTYTNGRFQSVHDKCMEDMRKLGFKNDAKSLAKGNVIDKYGSDVDEDDLEIVEPNHQTIDVVDSDDERSPEKSKSKNNTPQKNATAQPAASATATPPAESGRQVMLDITSSTENQENVECDVDITSLLQIDMNEHDEDDENGDSLLRRMNDDVGIATPPDFEQLDEINIQNDLKLNSKAMVTLKPVEQVSEAYIFIKVLHRSKSLISAFPCLFRLNEKKL